MPGTMPGVPMPGRRDNGPPMSNRGGPYEHGDHRSGSRHHQSNSEYDGSRPGSAGLQNYYAGQRHPARQSEAEQMLQAKRRMAAQRERELRNYHQEQQYNRSSSSGKPDRSMSPNANAMSEEDRRELIARQHRALYGDGSNLYNADGSSDRARSQDVSGRDASPYDGYNGQAQSGADSVVQMPPRDRAENTASPAGNSPQGDSQHARTSTSPAASPPLQGGVNKTGSTGVAPIGTRPPQNAGAVGGINKRATTPLTPSSLSYGYSSSETQNTSLGNDERAVSSSQNVQTGGDKTAGLGGSAWGNNAGGGWGKNALGTQASVWG